MPSATQPLARQRVAMLSATQPLARRQVVRPYAPVGHSVRRSLAEPQRVAMRGMRDFSELSARLINTCSYGQQGIPPQASKIARALSLLPHNGRQPENLRLSSRRRVSDATTPPALN